jgi:hypothetical protein
VFILLLTATVLNGRCVSGEIHLTQIAGATGDENLAGDGVAHAGDSSSGSTWLRLFK